MTKETIGFCILGVGLTLMVIGLVLYALKKKGGLVVTIIGFAMLPLLFLCVPENNNGNDQSAAVEELNFAECYHAYKENELKADDTYKGNRYRLTAQVRAIQSTDGSLLYWDDEVIVVFEIVVDNTKVVGEALFDKGQRDSLKDISVGDTITFVGECRSAGAWVDCELDKK